MLMKKKSSFFYREISFLHSEALAKFQSSMGGLIEFPALHRELFPSVA